MADEEQVKLLKSGVEAWNRWRVEKPEAEVDLRRADLSGANLLGADLTEANLTEADLTEADLAEADLAGADLLCADLTGAKLIGAKLIGAALEEADLTGADLTEADLSGAYLTEARASGALLSQADLSGAKLQGAKLVVANLIDANLRQTNLRGLDLLGADLTEANLTEADLTEADLTEADLRRALLNAANLSGAVLRRANLKSAGLYQANLAKADFFEADLTAANLNEVKGSAWFGRAVLREASLIDADLTGAKALQAHQLGGALTSGAKLPKDVARFDTLKVVEKASGYARKIFLAMLLGCAYAVLTIATTTDARLLTNAGTSPLPIIQAQIPIVGFYFAAPLILFGFYLYFHLYMQNIWERLATLPAELPDGRTLDKAADPWLLLGLIKSHFNRLRGGRTLVDRLQACASLLLAWWCVPLTLFLLWGRYLRRHDAWVTSWQVLLLVLAGAAAVYFHGRTVRILRGEGDSRLSFVRLLRTPLRWIGIAASALAVGLLCAMTSAAVIQSERLYTLCMAFTGEAREGPRWRVVAAVDRFANASISDASLSVTPDDWTGAETALVKGADLRGANLAGANARGVFLARADLRGANLRRSVLTLADLREARLLSADFSWSELSFADLSGAYTIQVDGDLRGIASETDAAEFDSDAPAIDLSHTVLIRAELRGARLVGADLSGAVLEMADLSGALLWGADFTEASVFGADFSGADLSGADLEGIHGLARNQIAMACADSSVTGLPQGFEQPPPCPEAEAE